MTNAIVALTEEMEKLSNRILEDLTSTLVNLSGSLTGIECGTHIKIPTGAGYVSYYKSAEGYEKITLWLTETMEIPICQNNELVSEDSNITKFT